MFRYILLAVVTLSIMATGPVAWAEDKPKTDREIPVFQVDDKALPLQKDVTLAPGDAVRLRLPNKKEVAIWCRPTAASGVERILEKEDIVLEWGEKPFKKLELRHRNLEGGEGAVSDWDSYIQQGAVITWSGNSDCIRELYAEGYKIILHTKEVEKGKIPVHVEVCLATEEEREDLLEGEELRKYFMARLQAKEVAVRVRAIKKLMNYVYNENLGATFRRKELHPTGRVIREAIRALAGDPNEKVKEKVESALRSLGDEEAILRYIQPTPPADDLGTGAGYAVARWCENGGGEKAAKHILTFLDSEDEKRVLFALGFFAHYEYEPAEKRLLKLLSHPSARVRLEAVEELRTHELAREAIPSTLQKLMRDDDKQVRRDAFRQSNRWHEKLAIDIIAGLRDKEADVRAMAAYALDSTRNPKAVDALLEATKDLSAGVRAQAADSLGRIRSKKAFDRFVEMLDDEDAYVRTSAAEALRSLDEARAIPKMRARLTKEKDEKVRKSIEGCIKEIERNHP